MPNASSCMLVLPMMMAPAALSFATTGASLRGTKPLSAGVPAVEGKRPRPGRLPPPPLDVSRVKGGGRLDGASLVQRNEGIEVLMGLGARQRCRGQRFARDLAG